MTWNSESPQSIAPHTLQTGGLLWWLLALITVKDVVTAIFVCMTGRYRLLEMVPHGVAYGIMAVAALRLIALMGVWRLNTVAVILYLTLGLAGAAIYAIWNSPVGNPLVSMGCAAVIALAFFVRVRGNRGLG